MGKNYYGLLDYLIKMLFKYAQTRLGKNLHLNVLYKYETKTIF